MKSSLATWPGPDWLDRRDHPDLDPAAERALRAAGLAFEDDVLAEGHLAAARAAAPDHRAVLIAHYRFNFYKHRFVEAERFARDCVALAARDLALPADFRQVTARDHDFGAPEKRTRFWLFALQAWAYVLLRLGRAEDAFEAFHKIIEVDPRDQTKTRMLVETLRNAAAEDASNSPGEERLA